MQGGFRYAPEGDNGGGTYRVELVAAPVRNELAGACVFSMRWNTADTIMAIRKVKVGYVCTTGFTTPQTVDIGVYSARDWLVPDEGGNGAPTMDLPKLDSSTMPSRICGCRSMVNPGHVKVAGLLAVAPGVRTLDAQPMATVMGFPTATAGVFSAEYEKRSFGLTLATNSWVVRNQEGIVMNLLTTLGAAGVLRIYIGLEWDEITENRN
jgi:hypothetical protein